MSEDQSSRPRGRPPGTSGSDRLVLDAIGIALDVIYHSSDPSIQGKTARWAVCLANPEMKTWAQVKDDVAIPVICYPTKLNPVRVDNLAKNLRQRLNGTGSGKAAYLEHEAFFVRTGAEWCVGALAARHRLVSELYAKQLLELGWPPVTVERLLDLAGFYNQRNDGYFSLSAAIGELKRHQSS